MDPVSYASAIKASQARREVKLPTEDPWVIPAVSGFVASQFDHGLTASYSPSGRERPFRQKRDETRLAWNFLETKPFSSGIGEVFRSLSIRIQSGLMKDVLVMMVLRGNRLKLTMQTRHFKQYLFLSRIKQAIKRAFYAFPYNLDLVIEYVR